MGDRRFDLVFRKFNERISVFSEGEGAPDVAVCIRQQSSDEGNHLMKKWKRRFG